MVSPQYNTVDFVRTIEDMLSIGPLNLNDAVAVPMADVFDLTQTTWSFTATPSALLANTTLPITFPSSANRLLRPTHNAEYWAKATEGMDFSAEDRFDFARYNRILWKGLMGDKPYPAAPSGLDLRQNRAELLARYEKALRSLMIFGQTPAISEIVAAVWRRSYPHCLFHQVMRSADEGKSRAKCSLRCCGTKGFALRREEESPLPETEERAVVVGTSIKACRRPRQL